MGNEVTPRSGEGVEMHTLLDSAIGVATAYLVGVAEPEKGYGGVPLLAVGTCGRIRKISMTSVEFKHTSGVE